MEEKIYPDVSHLFAAKAERRRQLAALPWEEKVKIIEKMREAMPRRKRPAALHTLVMPMHDPHGLLFPHLLALVPQLREICGRVIISITPLTRVQQPYWVEQVMADHFFGVCEFTQSLPVGDEFVQLYAHAALISAPNTLLHLCFIDRVAYALQSPYRTQFLADMQSLQPDATPLIFQRSETAWATHPRNYRAIEAMLTVVAEGYFQQSLDFAWCHLVVPAGQLQAILPQVRRHDLAVCGELVLLLKETIQTKAVEWLAWEDPFILNRDPDQLKREREQSPTETQKRLNYVLPMIEAIHHFHTGSNS